MQDLVEIVFYNNDTMKIARGFVLSCIFNIKRKFQVRDSKRFSLNYGHNLEPSLMSYFAACLMSGIVQKQVPFVCFLYRSD